MTITSGVVRHQARSGNKDNDYFQPLCRECSWSGAMYSNRTIEGRQLAERDMLSHNNVHHFQD